MTASLRVIDLRCYRCGRRATMELLDRSGASVAGYCRPCGRIALRNFAQFEAELLDDNEDSPKGSD